MSTNPPRTPGGGPTPEKPKLPVPPKSRFRIGWWVAWILALLAINYWLGSRATQAQQRVQVPYSPYFIKQVQSGNVTEISSKGTAIQGTFKKAESYQKSKKTTEFKTEIPAFADTDALSQLLQSKQVVINAQPLDTGGPWWENLLLGFGPTILLVGLLVSMSVGIFFGLYPAVKASRLDPIDSLRYE